MLPRSIAAGTLGGEPEQLGTLPQFFVTAHSVLPCHGHCLGARNKAGAAMVPTGQADVRVDATGGLARLLSRAARARLVLNPGTATGPRKQAPHRGRRQPE